MLVYCTNRRHTKGFTQCFLYNLSYSSPPRPTLLQINAKPKLGKFGPLQDGMIVRSVDMSISGFWVLLEPLTRPPIILCSPPPPPPPPSKAMLAPLVRQTAINANRRSRELASAHVPPFRQRQQLIRVCIACVIRVRHASLAFE
jgi:hypothetical protein